MWAVWRVPARPSPPPAKAASRALASGFGVCLGLVGLGREREPGAPLFVGRAQGDAADRADWDDQLFRILVSRVDGQRQEPVARLAGDRSQGQPLAVRELDLDVRA